MSRGGALNIMGQKDAEIGSGGQEAVVREEEAEDYMKADDWPQTPLKGAATSEPVHAEKKSLQGKKYRQYRTKIGTHRIFQLTKNPNFPKCVSK